MTQFGRYELLRRLGAGGMGEVFLARLPGAAGFEKLLVVKRIHPAWQRDPAFIEMFLDEARIAARLNHPNIVQIFELGMVDGVHFLAMEYVEGVSLASLLAAAQERKKPLPMGAVCRIGADSAAALAHAHRAFDAAGASLKLVHRDVSPQNILVGLDGGVKLIDFGIAKATGRLQESNPGALRGKCAYASPEQVDGAELDARSDVFALGIVLWEACTGGRLFRAESEAATLKKVTLCEVPRPSTLVPGVPAALEALLLRALAKSPTDRFEDAGEMREALEAIAAQCGPEATLAGLEKYVRELFADEISTRSGPLAVDAEPLTGPTRQLPVGEPTGPDLSGGAGRPRRASFAEAARREVGVVTQSLAAPGKDDTSSDSVPGLRAPRTSFVGRAADLEQLAQRFDGGAQLVTVVGPGGTGKTRLALELARATARRREGEVWFCDLTEARTVPGVCGAVAGALGLQLSANETDLAATVGQALSGHERCLLVLDNFEQVVRHSPATVGRWLALAPGARFLVTSREPLKLPDEAVLELAPLPPEEAGQLFLDRAAAARPSFKPTGAEEAAVGRLVHALDGLPLAIELAASRMKVMTAEQLAARLSRRFELLKSSERGAADRQATLRGAIDWSWELLDPVERAALGECSVFRGGFSLEAAEAVLSPETGGPPVVDTLQSLREKSLLRTYEPPGGAGLLRFGFYESIREYAALKLAESGTQARTEERHCRHFLAEATRLGEAVEGEHGARALRELSVELENLLSVHERAMRATPPMLSTALGVLVGLDPLVTIRGPVGFFGELLDRTLAQVRPGLVPAPLYARALCTQATSLRLRSRPDESGRAHERAIEAAREAGAGLEARAYAGWGIHLFHVGQLENSFTALTRAIELARQAGDGLFEAQALSSRGAVELRRGQLAPAEADLRASLAILGRIGGRYGETVVSSMLGVLTSARGDYAEAKGHLERTLELARDFEARASEASALKVLSSLEPDQGRPEEGLSRALEAVAVARRFGVRHIQGTCLGQLGAVQQECGRLEDAKAAYGEAVARLDENNDKRLAAFYRGLLASVEATRGEAEAARRLLDSAKAQAAPTGDPFIVAAIELCRTQVEWAQAKAADAAGEVEKAAALRAAAKRRIEEAERPDAPAPAASSAYVRLALRLAKRAVESP